MEHGFYAPSRGYWQTNSDVPQSILDTYPADTIEVGLPPSKDHVYDPVNGWVELVPDSADVLQSKREVASLDRVTFLLWLVSLGKMSEVSADEASDGTWPTVWNSQIAALPLQQRMEIKAAWKEADIVAYRGAFMQRIAMAAQTESAPITVTEAELDAGFGVTA